jgi:hypothetical protein
MSSSSYLLLIEYTLVSMNLLQSHNLAEIEATFESIEEERRCLTKFITEAKATMILHIKI